MLENKLFEALLDVIPFGAYAVDVDTYEVVYANKLMRENMYAPKETHCWGKVFGQEEICSWCSIFKLQDRRIKKLVSGKYICEFFDEADDKWIKSYDELMSWPDGRNVKYSILVDITDQKEIQGSMMKSHAALAIKNRQVSNTNQNLQIAKLELQKSLNELEIQKQKAEESTKFKSSFLANMSHEIRTPMNAIIGMTHLAKETSLDEKQLGYINKIESASNNLLNIINDILDFSKIEAGKLKIENIDFDINTIISNVRTLVELKAYEKSLQFSVKNDSKNSIFYGDSFRIEQILINILSNAIKFTTVGEVELIINDMPNDIVRFCVRDTGIGISGSHQESLFEPFNQADAGTTKKYGGTGLGLSISRELVELMGGKIWIESEVGVGSEFIFELKLPHGNEENIQSVTHASSMKEEIASLHGSKILLCEDNTVNQEIIIGLLENSGIIIDIANNGKEAIDKFKSGRYDLILMDLQMPIIDGYEATKLIREFNKNIPIIALTANAMREDVEKTKTHGMNEHLNKPIDIEKFYKTLLKYISKKNAAHPESTSSLTLTAHPESTSLLTLTAHTEVSETKDEFHIPEFKTIDTKQSLKYLAGNKKLYLKILNNFLNTYKDFSFANLNSEEFQRATHTIKGLSANIGATALHAVSKELDERQDRTLLDSWHSEMKKVIEELSDKLPKTTKEETKAQKKELSHVSEQSDKYLFGTKREELFSKLKEAAATSRPKECEVIISEIERYELSTEDNELLNKAKILIEKYEFKEASTMLKEIE
ncbi:MAG: ATP-binding protein [Sulfurimonas sp.]|jgi:signal transduction histidine kinase/CheY-like chemotaxis protein/HPt (histidine-containing phosphotransfer) domain-containing protein